MWKEAEHCVKSYCEALPGAVLNASQMKTLAPTNPAITAKKT